ncbi:MAG: hypothetical protein K2N16_10120, partial [Muribaculaceae bacterium]|nr:hypothetical protein [Muribaculaceae bacterium]
YKGSDEYEAYVGTWKVVAEHSVGESLEYEDHPIEWEITIKPNRVNSLYEVYGWGTSIFTNSWGTPIAMEFDPANGNLNLISWGLCSSYTPTPDPNAGFKFSSYVANLYPIYESSEGSYAFYAVGQKILCTGKLDPATDKVVLEGQTDPKTGFPCAGVEAALGMGGPSGSQILAPIQIIEPKYRFVKNGVEYVPYTLAPYIMTRVSPSTKAAPAPKQDKAFQLQPVNGKRAQAAAQQTSVRGQFPISAKK